MNTREIQNKKQRILIYLLVLIPFLYFLYIMVYPLGVSVYYSLTKWKGIGSPKFVGLANYKTLVKSGDFWLVTKNTLFLSLVCTIGQVGIALIIAFLMTLRRLRFKAFHRAVIFFSGCHVGAGSRLCMAFHLQQQLWTFKYVPEFYREAGVDSAVAG